MPNETRLVSVPIDTTKLRREAEDPHVTIMASAQMIAAADEIERLRAVLAQADAVIADGRTSKGRPEMSDSGAFWRWHDAAIERHAKRRELAR